MNPRIVALITVALLLAPTVPASLFDDWIPEPNPYHRDTVYTTTLTSGSYRTSLWTVDKRNAQGRPLHATRTWNKYHSQGFVSSTDELSWTWTFDLPGSPLIGSPFWPSRVDITSRDSAGTLFETQFRAVEWLADSRSIVSRSNFIVPGCPWSDSLVYDTQNRQIQQVTCRLRVVSGDSSIERRTRTWFYESPSDSDPRWISEHSDDPTLASDSAFIVGPVARPILARIFRHDPRRPLDTLPVIDSVRWNENGHILSRARWTQQPDTSHPTMYWSAEYAWDNRDLLSVIERFWVGDSAMDQFWESYSYSEQSTSTQRRAPRPSVLRRTAAGRVSLTLPASGPARVEWVGPDGRRALLHNGPVPQGALELATPRGMGFLRVQQAGQVRVHSLPWW
jgi:hypothetical protein